MPLGGGAGWGRNVASAVIASRRPTRQPVGRSDPATHADAVQRVRSSAASSATPSFESRFSSPGSPTAAPASPTASRSSSFGDGGRAWSCRRSRRTAERRLITCRPCCAAAGGCASGRWGGFRRGAICALPLHACVTGFDDHGHAHPRLHWQTEKEGVLRRAPDGAARRDAEPRLDHRLQQPWRERQLNHAIDRLIDVLAAEKVRPSLTLHGLRHPRGVELALAGASDSQIMNQLAPAESRTAQIFRRQAPGEQWLMQASTRSMLRDHVGGNEPNAAFDTSLILKHAACESFVGCHSSLDSAVHRARDLAY